MELRPYQRECIETIKAQAPGAYLAQMATGLGKTVTFANIPRHGERMLILSHREELVEQPRKYFDCTYGIERASSRSHGEEVSGVTLADNGDVEIGPLTTFRGVTFSDVIRRTIPVLGEAADMAGGPQLRAAGTIGGNVCNGITSADTASTLVALDAVLRVRGPKGEREVPISQWYQGVGKVALAPYELLVKIVIPYDNYVGYTGHYIKYAQRNAMDIATLGVSCLVKLTSDKKMVDDAALAFGVAGPVPMRSPAAEAAVRGLPIGVAVAAIGEAALADVNPRTSWRASKEFRIQLVKELSARSLREAARKGGADV